VTKNKYDIGYPQHNHRVQKRMCKLMFALAKLYNIPYPLSYYIDQQHTNYDVKKVPHTERHHTKKNVAHRLKRMENITIVQTHHLRMCRQCILNNGKQCNNDGNGNYFFSIAHWHLLMVVLTRSNC